MLKTTEHKCFCVEFDRKTADGMRRWGGGDIYAESTESAEKILVDDILPFIDSNLPDTVFNAKITGELVGTVEAGFEIYQSESTKYLEGLNNWFYFPQIDNLIKLKVFDVIHVEKLLRYFAEAEVFEACSKLSTIIKNIKNDY